MVILDTNVVSEMMKPDPSHRVMTWLSERRASEVQLLCHREEVAKMTKLNIAIHIQKIIIRTNKILDVSAGEV